LTDARKSIPTSTIDGFELGFRSSKPEHRPLNPKRSTLKPLAPTLSNQPSAQNTLNLQPSTLNPKTLQQVSPARARREVAAATKRWSSSLGRYVDADKDSDVVGEGKLSEATDAKRGRRAAASVAVKREEEEAEAGAATEEVSTLSSTATRLSSRSSSKSSAKSAASSTKAGIVNAGKGKTSQGASSKGDKASPRAARTAPEDSATEEDMRRGGRPRRAATCMRWSSTLGREVPVGDGGGGATPDGSKVSSPAKGASPSVSKGPSPTKASLSPVCPSQRSPTSAAKVASRRAGAGAGGGAVGGARGRSRTAGGGVVKVETVEESGEMAGIDEMEEDGGEVLMRHRASSVGAASSVGGSPTMPRVAARVADVEAGGMSEEEKEEGRTRRGRRQVVSKPKHWSSSRGCYVEARTGSASLEASPGSVTSKGSRSNSRRTKDAPGAAGVGAETGGGTRSARARNPPNSTTKSSGKEAMQEEHGEGGGRMHEGAGGVGRGKKRGLEREGRGKEGRGGEGDSSKRQAVDVAGPRGVGMRQVGAADGGGASAGASSGKSPEVQVGHASGLSRFCLGAGWILFVAWSSMTRA
jgi:hypothetical protein